MRIAAVFAALAAILAIPFALKPKNELLAKADETIVIVTPHNEQIRYEFTRAFARQYQALTGRTVRIDWRMPGGTSEIARYLKGEFFAAFEREWRGMGRPWTAEVAAAFDNPRITPSSSPETDTPAQAARRAFLASRSGIGIDIFFGGGAFDFAQQAAAGRLVSTPLLERRPEWFTENSLPYMVSGEVFYDRQGRWFGAALSSFGICDNTDSLRRLGVTAPPAGWADLANPIFFKQAALADPTKSGSAAKAFEMIIQQQMQIASQEDADKEKGLARGWIEGLRIIQRASANARYFTDAASQVPVDVSLGDAAIGMCIDFYGRFQSEAVQTDKGSSRLRYFTPAGGSSVGVDPIGLLRGAPNQKAAEAFIEFVLSLEGQKLWNFKPDTPGGPVRYALRRQPVRKELYAPEYAGFRSDPDVDPYVEARSFFYHSEWTGPLFKVISFIVRVMCLDSHDEQVAAWRALIETGFPPQATAQFEDLTAVNYEAARDRIQPALAAADPIREVQLARELGDHFRRQYQNAERLARKGK